MPRLRRTKVVVCRVHETWCKLAGGSDFVSARCAPVLPPDPELEALVNRPDPELDAMIREAREAAKALPEAYTAARAANLGIPPEEARTQVEAILRRCHADVKAFEEAERKRWTALRPAEKAAELDGMAVLVDPVLASVMRFAQQREQAAVRVARADPVPEAAPVRTRRSDSAPAARRRPQRPAQATSAQPAGEVEERPKRRRRRSTPQFTSINVIPW